MDGKPVVGLKEVVAEHLQQFRRSSVSLGRCIAYRHVLVTSLANGDTEGQLPAFPSRQGVE